MRSKLPEVFRKERGAGAACSAGAQLLMVLLLLTAVPGAAGDAPLTIGDQPPRAVLQDLRGLPVTIPDDVRGKVVIIRFWADWCTSCAEAMPALDSLYNQYKGKGLAVVAINAGQSREKVSAFVNRVKVGYPVLLDPDMKTTKRYNVVGLPRTFILDRNGSIRYKLVGDVSQDLVKKLAVALL